MTRETCTAALTAQILAGLTVFDPREQMEIFNEMVPKIQKAILNRPRRPSSAEYSLQLPDSQFRPETKE